MNGGIGEDELAAIAIAAQVLLVPVTPPTPIDSGALWRIAGRTREPDPNRTRRVARSRSRWEMSGRVRA